MPWFYFLSSSLNNNILNSWTLRNKLFIADNSSFILSRLILFISVNNNEFNDSLIQKFKIFLSIFSILCQNYFGFRMFDNILTCLLIICGVDSYRNASSHQGTIKGYEPLRCVKPYYIYHLMLSHLIRYQWFCEFYALFIILFVVYCHLSKTIITHTPFTLCDKADL